MYMYMYRSSTISLMPLTPRPPACFGAILERKRYHLPMSLLSHSTHPLALEILRHRTDNHIHNLCKSAGLLPDEHGRKKAELEPNAGRAPCLSYVFQCEMLQYIV